MRSFTLLALFTFISLNLFGQIYIMDGSPITSCNGFFMDSGGGSGNYGSGESFSTTICSDGSSGTHIKLNFSGVNIAAGDMLCFFDGPNNTFPQLSCHTDFLPGAPFIIQATAANPGGCVTITFDSDGSGEEAGWSADISCIPSCQTIIATLLSTDPPISPPDTGYIDICPGDRVYFYSAGEYPQNGTTYDHSDLTSGFYWDFGDGNAAVGPNTSHVYEEPGGYVVELYIEDQFGCNNTNFISQRIRVSTYPDFELAGDIPEEICAGDTISLNAFVSNIDSTFEVSVSPTEGGFPTGGVRSDSLPLPDGTGVSYQTSIIFNNFSPGQVLTDINDLLSICVNMEHSWMHDLQIELICPDGTTVVLQQQVFQGLCLLGVPNESDEGFDPPLQGIGWDYCWTPTATNGNWTQYWQNTGVGTLPAGDYNAFGDLNDFLGCPLNGEWTIVVQDLWGIDNGWIFEWSIDFAPELYPNVETFTPELIDWAWNQNSTIVYYSPDSITAALPNAGNPSYTFTVTDDFGCSYDTTVVVTVLPPNHPDCFTCEALELSLADSTICNGEEVAIDASVDDPLADQSITFEAFSNEEFDGDIHPPGNPIASSVFVSYVNPSLLTDPITQIESVCVNIEHNYDADVEIRLQAPNGTIIELSTDNGGSGDDYLNTCFTPVAVTPITSGTAPFTGDWQPEGNWADLIGSSITGDWTLLVADDQNGFSGVFIDWAITFNIINEINYFWSPGTGLTCNNCPDPTATPTATTSYIVNAIDAYGCSVTDTITIEVLSAFAAPILSCGLAENGFLTIDWLAVPGASDYEVSFDGGITWIPANGILSHTIPGLVDGNVVDILVQVVSMNANCPPLVGSLQCVYTEACAMTIDTSGTISPSCWNTNDASVFMSTTNGQSPVTYAIDGGISQGPNFTGVSPGFHSVVATDNIGCTDSISFTIVAPPAISLTVVSDSVNCNAGCDGQSTALATGGTGTFSYVWNTSPATLNDTAINLCAGNYTVTATDINGCTSSQLTTVAEPINLLVTSIITNNITCFGGADGSITVTPFGGTPPYSYLWDDPVSQTTATASGLDQGLYNLTITDNNGCTTTANAGVSEPSSAMTLTVMQTFEGCNNAFQNIAEVLAMGGTGTNYSYEWSSGATTSIATGLDDILQTVTVTDENGCTAVESIQITELDPIDVSLTGNDPSCFGGLDGEVSTVSIIGGSGNFTYEWNTTPVQNGTSISGVAGNFNYTLVVTDDQGCTGSASYQMGQPTEMQLSLTSTVPSCNGFVDGEATVLNVIGGTSGYTYLWDANTGNQNTQTATSLSSGTYSVTVTDANGCSTSSQVIIDEPTTMQLVFQESDNFCAGQNDGAIELNVLGGTPNYTFIWENGETTQNLENLWSGVYYVTVTDNNGCFVIDSATVNGPPPLDANVLIDDVSCFEENDGVIIIEIIGGSPPFQYSLDNVEFTGANLFTGLEGGTYDLYAVDINGCTWSSTAIINSPEEFTVNAGAEDDEIELGESTELIPSQYNGFGFVNFLWTAPYPGTLVCEDSTTLECNTPIATPQNTIIYELYGIDANGCEATDQITIRVIKEREVYVATGFTPNGDGINDLLMVHGPENTVVKLCRVYDRWGNMVFEYDVNAVPTDPDILVNDTTFGWDGDFRDKPMNPGVFIWYVEVEYIDGFTKIFKGNTTLIR
jgi:gliding motility-associated-like protein